MNLEEALGQWLPLIEADLERRVTCGRELLRGFYGMLSYHLGFVDERLQPIRAHAGKRVRPILTLLTAEGSGGAAAQALPAAVAIELVHNFSLIHDDVEDGSPLRRHRPTVWRLWGIPQAVNAGDAMFTLAHQALLDLVDLGVPSERVLHAIRRFEETCLALTEGQYLDMAFEARESVTESEYLQMIERKTGALLSFAAEAGALIAGACERDVLAYRRFGAALGRAFQIRDDVLGIWGDEEVTGKSAESDILSRKKSLPVVHGLCAAGRAGDALRQIYRQAELTMEQVPEVLALLEATGSREYAEQLINAAHREALAALTEAQPGCGVDVALRELLDMAAHRTA